MKPPSPLVTVTLWLALASPAWAADSVEAVAHRISLMMAAGVIYGFESQDLQRRLALYVERESARLGVDPAVILLEAERRGLARAEELARLSRAERAQFCASVRPSYQPFMRQR
jgi:hypothetical protein